MRRFRHFRLRVSGWLRWTVLLMALCYLVIRLIEALLLRPLSMVAENEARLKAIDAINRIVLSSMDGALDHNKLVTYEKDQQGNIVAYHINTQAVNHVATQAAVAVRGEFGNLSVSEFGVPLGALSGSQFLATLGPRIPVLMVPIGSVVIDIRQEFRAEGINQTRHRVWLHVEARVRVILPAVSREINVSSNLPVTDTVVLGRVPTYYGGNLGGISVPVAPPAADPNSSGGQ